MTTDMPETRRISKLHQLGHKIIGGPKDVHDPSIFHKITLIAILSWIGLGADGLSSSAYGPEEAFRAIGSHTYLALALAVATALTVFIISFTYSKIIEHFPHGGGGYIVATHTLGKKAGVVSGSALLVDYILTITISLAASGDALFSFLPLELHQFKLMFKIALIASLMLLNLRGVKESITTLTPIFAIFVITHALLLGYGIFSNAGNAGQVVTDLSQGFSSDLMTIGFIGILAIFLRAFSLGGGTYTGIEAVSNGLQIMREPKVQTGKKTMAYMATSLAITAGGLLVLYLLFNIHPVEGKTLNAVLADALFGGWKYGYLIALITILSEGAILFVAAQAGFIDGPRVMANMAKDSWLPHRFSSLSERLTMQNGVLLMGGAALAIMIYTKGSVVALVVMYAINVFLTFSLSELGMLRFFIRNRHRINRWKKNFFIFFIGLILCVTILSVTLYEKFGEGGWVTLIITSIVVALCYLVKRHYIRVKNVIRSLDEVFNRIRHNRLPNYEHVDRKESTAVLLVHEFDGLGVRTLLSIVTNFPGLYKNIIFISVGEIDSGAFKGKGEVESLKASVRKSLEKYVNFARKHGFPADYRMDIGTDVVETATNLCETIAKEFPKSTFFAGKPVFRHEGFIHRLLHSETPFAIQRRLQFIGAPMVVLPIKVEEEPDIQEPVAINLSGWIKKFF